MGYPKIDKTFVGDGRYNLSRRNGRRIEYVIVHYTANGHSSNPVSALNHCLYFRGGDRQSSADWFICDAGIWQFNPDQNKYYTWAIGGGSSYGPTNANSVSIECISEGEDFTQKQKDLLRDLVTALMDDYGIPANKVLRHFDCNSIRKSCPRPYTPNGTDPSGGKWKELHNYITTKEDDMPAPQDLWNYGTGTNNVRAQDRLVGIDMAANAANSRAEALQKELLRTDDPTGDETTGSIYTRVAWMDKRLRDQEDKLSSIEAKLDAIAGKLG